ncbi:MAG: DUF6288 domain-containing protein [Planctomycetota bacterium]
MKHGALANGLAAFLLTAACGTAQVHYFEDGRPWSQRAGGGPDKDVDGWFYNLGETGLRVELVPDAPTHLVVRHVFAGSPAQRRIKVGDHIVGANGQAFGTPHENGYGMKVFGPKGPIADFAKALEYAQTAAGKGQLQLSVQRDGGKDGKGSIDSLRLKVSRKLGSYAATFPTDCAKTERVLDKLLPWLAEQQRQDGSWGSPPHSLFAPLALMASGDRRYRKAIERCARFHARTTKAKDHDGLINWRYAAAGLMLSEYYLQTGDRWVQKELEEIRDFLLHSQYTHIDQLHPQALESHPDAVPKQPQDSIGGWGHNPGFEGYGPIAMLTGQGAAALAMMRHCGIDVPRERLDLAFDFLARGTGANGYVWYGDDAASDTDWADPGRTGAAGVANWLCPYDQGEHRERALQHARCIGAHPLSFPDTHGSPTMGMVFAAMAAHLADSKSFAALMDANRWWFTLARCQDGTFYYQPNRDNAGYGDDSRLSASAAVALILSLPKRSLYLSGKSLPQTAGKAGR